MTKRTHYYIAGMLVERQSGDYSRVSSSRCITDRRHALSSSRGDVHAGRAVRVGRSSECLVHDSRRAVRSLGRSNRDSVRYATDAIQRVSLDRVKLSRRVGVSLAQGIHSSAVLGHARTITLESPGVHCERRCAQRSRRGGIG